MKKSGSSVRWLAQHESDKYVKLARQQGLRSRAAFKLLEIDEKHRLFAPGMVVIDLGAAPGGWSQVAARKVGAKGMVIAVDMLEMRPIPGVHFVQEDFTGQAALDGLFRLIDHRPVDLVISDMAPNLSGVRDIDQPRSAHLAELAMDLAASVLRPGGGLVAKVFEGTETGLLRQECQRKFRSLANVKPRASRPRSKEIYLVGCGYGR